ncbi:MAG: dual specificity protein phosphatase family protein [Anaerolineales bacterium]|nr:dual specificity protein phosphatase family protein [Anaerolineales bacterium]
MHLKKVKLRPEISGKLYLHSMPGRLEPLDSFLYKASRHEIDLVVCLAADEEISRLSPEYSLRIQEDSFPFERIVFVINDYGIPLDINSFLEFVTYLAQSINAGQSVLIHCAAGIGRTGLAAASIMMQLGYSIQEAISSIYDAGSNPEIGEQGAFLRVFDTFKAECHSD